jgi:hypothetical protein
MCLHQTAVPGLAERLKDGQLLGPLDRLQRVVRAQAAVGQDAQRPDANIGELAALLRHPGSVVAGQERPLNQ